MTVRNVGGAVIDLTERARQADQLSAYYPLNGQYALTGPLDAEKAGGSAAEKTLTFRGTSEDKRSTAEVVYVLADDAQLEDHHAREERLGGTAGLESGRRHSRRR